MFELKKGDGTVIARRARIAGGGGLFGLMFKRKIGEDEALVFRLNGEKFEIVHTFFLTFPVDLVFADEKMRIVGIRKRVPPWRICLPRVKSGYLVELAAGKSERTGLKVGDFLTAEKVISVGRQRK